MTGSMRQAFLPFLIVACLAGLAVFEYPLGRPRILFSLAYIAFIWSIYGYFYFREPFRAIVRTWPKVAVLAYHINLFTLLIIFISNIYRIKEYHCCLDKLATVDDTLEKLGTRKDYSKVRKSTIKITSIWYIHALFINSMELLWTYNDTFLNVLFISGVINYPFHAVSIIILRFGILVSYTGSRFDRVNEHIRGLITDEDYGLTRSARALFVTSRPQSSMHVQKYKEMIRILMHVHSETCRIVQKINTIFGVELALIMALLFFNVAGTFCIIYEVMSLEHLSALFVVKFVFTILNNTILNVVRLCYVHHVSESLNVKAMKTKRHLCQLANCVYDAEVREDVVQFIMQIIHGVPKLTGMGLFVIGYEFLQKFYTSMATVLVVILQMYDAARLRRIFDIIDMQ